MIEEMVIIVDEQDNIIGRKARATLQVDDIYRVSSLNIYNQRGEILLGKRAPTKKNNPNVWSPIVNGTNAVDETYESNIRKEALEEIGLALTSFELVQKSRIIEKHDHFVSFFKVILSGNEIFTLDPAEISEARWFTKSEILSLLQTQPELFVPGFLKNIFPIL